MHIYISNTFTFHIRNLVINTSSQETFEVESFGSDMINVKRKSISPLLDTYLYNSSTVQLTSKFYKGENFFFLYVCLTHVTCLCLKANHIRQLKKPKEMYYSLHYILQRICIIIQKIETTKII